MNRATNQSNQSLGHHYVAFLSEYGNFIAAFGWSQFQQHGSGIVIIETQQNQLKLWWQRIADCTNKQVEMIGRCDFSKQTLVRFPNGCCINFSPSLPPPLAYGAITPQCGDFIKQASPQFRW